MKMLCVARFLTSAFMINTVSTEFAQVTTCNCVGYNTQYECAVEGGVATKWRVTALNCEIQLRHSQFVPANEANLWTCSNSNEQVYARIVTASDNTYISRLFVNISQNLHGQSVECLQISGSGDTTIGTNTISLDTCTYHFDLRNNYMVV